MGPEVLTSDANILFSHAEQYAPPKMGEWYLILPIKLSENRYTAVYIVNDGCICEPNIESCTVEGAIAKLKAHLHEVYDGGFV